MRFLPPCVIAFAIGVVYRFTLNAAVFLFFLLFIVFLFMRSRNFRIVFSCSIFAVPGYFYAFANISEANSLKSELSCFSYSDTVFQGKVLKKTEFDYGESLEFESLKASCGDKIFAKKFKILVYFSKKQERLSVNSFLTLKGRLEEINSFKNPESFSYSDYMALKGFYYKLTRPEILSSSEGKIDSIRSCAVFIKSKLLEYFLIRHGDRSAAVIVGCLFGDKTFFSDELTEVFKKTGAMHLLAASGFNVSVIASICFFALGRLKIKKTLSFLVSLILICLYVFIADASASIVRAALMFSVSVVASFCNKDYDLLSSLSAAALVMICADPAVVLDCGFQLSVLAVVGIYLYCVFFQPAIVAFPNFSRIFLEAFLATMSVEVLTAPLCAFYFCQWSAVSSISNIAAAPIAVLILSLGMIESLFSVLFRDIAFIIGYGTDFLSFCLIGILKYLAGLSFSCFPVCAPSIHILLSYYAVLYLALQKFKDIVGIFVPFAPPVLFILLFIFPRNLSDGNLKIIFFDVGSADACLVVAPENKKILIDAGTSGESGGVDAGKEIIASFLLKSGISELDYVFLTHEHEDHIGGFKSLSDKIKINRVFVSEYFSHAHKFETISAGTVIQISESVSLEAIHPESSYRYSSKNNLSLVLKLSYFNASVLFCGDIEKEAELDILDRDKSIKADIIKVAHHGSSTSSGKLFLRAVMPKVAVISSGRGREKASVEVVESFEKLGALVFITDKHGAIEADILKNGEINIKSYKK